MLQRSGAVLGVDHMAWLMLDAANPFGKFGGIRDCGWKEHEPHIGTEEDECLLPHNSPLSITHVMDLIEDNPGNLSYDLRSPIEHAT